MAVFLGHFFCFALTKFAPKKRLVIFFKEKTSQLFIFAIVYKKNYVLRTEINI